MKNTTMNLMLAAAALLVASTVASAQTMKAEIPFAFQSAGKLMAPGTYLVTPANGEAWFQITNLRSGKSALLGSSIPQDPQKEWKKSGQPVLQFACRDSGCSLKRIWTHAGAPAHEFADPKGAKDKPVTLALIRLAAGTAK